jgi:uncharacterized membrane protein
MTRNLFATKPSVRWAVYLVLCLPFIALLLATARGYSTQSLLLVASSVFLFLCAWWASMQLLGFRNTTVFAAVGLGLGWFAEQMGSSRGWFFGRYTYTDVLGPRLGDVPLVIPLMWFALCFVGYILAKLMLWRDPMTSVNGWPQRLITALLAAMLVTTFDLGADPYFVFVLKAWIMQKTDGGWFGETLQGFAGWMLISFLIVMLVQGLMRIEAHAEPSKHVRLAALLPIGIYTSSMIFQMIWGHPIETRAVAFFAMGIPILVAAVAWWHWRAGVMKAVTR